MRLFIASPLSTDELQAAVGRYQSRLHALGWEGTEVKPEALHLTYVFLGETDASRVEDLSRCLGELSGRAVRPWLLNRAGVFTDRFTSAPRVVWLGQRGNSPNLEALQQAIARIVEPDQARASHQRWSPHLTVLRVRRPVTAASLPSWTPMAVSLPSVELIESVLTETGPRYHSLCRVALRGLG